MSCLRQPCQGVTRGTNCRGSGRTEREQRSEVPSSIEHDKQQRDPPHGPVLTDIDIVPRDAEREQQRREDRHERRRPREAARVGSLEGIDEADFDAAEEGTCGEEGEEAARVRPGLPGVKVGRKVAAREGSDLGVLVALPPSNCESATYFLIVLDLSESDEREEGEDLRLDL